MFISAICYLLSVGFTGCTPSHENPLEPKKRLRVATTTSLYDTGLWEYLEPMFEKAYNAEMDVMYTGTGKAIEYGRRGDVDVIMVHSKKREEKFVSQGYGIKRVPIAYNYFLIVGPKDDPAGIKRLSPAAAFKKLMKEKKGKFVSRGDKSGTHGKEKEIWIAAGFEYAALQKQKKWYIESGSGMGATLLLASEKQAYILTDIGTFVSYKSKLNLVPIVEKGDILLNVYSAIAISPKKHSKTKIELANKLIDFLTSSQVQKLIGNYGLKKYKMQLFIPCAENEPLK